MRPPLIVEGAVEFLGIQHGLRVALNQNAVVDEHHLIGVPGQQGKIVGGHQDGQVVVLRISSSMSINVSMPSTSTPESGSSRMRMLGMGSSASASSTRCTSPPERVPTRLLTSSSPCTRERHSATVSFMALPRPRKAGRRLMQQANRSDTLTGSLGSKAGLWGNVADAGLFASLSRLGKGDDALVLPLSQNGFQEGGFARAVGADDGGHFAAVDVKIHVLQNAVGPDFHGHILYPKAAGMAAGTAVM